MATENIALLDLVTMQAYIDAEMARHAENQEAWMAYNGLYPDPLIVQKDDIRDIVKVNIIRSIVDAHVNKLFGMPPDIELPDTKDGKIKVLDPGEETSVSADPTESDAETWLKGCLRANNWEAFLLEMGMNGANCGTPYYRIDPSAPVPAYDNPSRPYIRFHPLTPQDMSIIHSFRDIDETRGYVWMYDYIDPVTKRGRIDRQLVEVQPDGYWKITDQHAYFDGSTADYFRRGMAVNWETDGVADWRHKWPPIGHCKNRPCPGEVYGEPDVTLNLIEMNKSLNFILSNWARINKHHAKPLVWLIGYQGDAKKLDASVGRVLSLGGNPDTIAIGQLAPAVDGSLHERQYTVVLSAMLEASGTPAVVLGRSEGEMNNPSGTSLRMRLMPLTDRIIAKRKLYGPMIVELCRRLLELGGWGAHNIVQLHWPDITPTDPVQTSLVLESDQRLGIVSRQTLSSLRNYNYENEQQNMANERASDLKNGVMPAMQPAQGQGTVPGALTNEAKPPTPNVESASAGAMRQQQRSNPNQRQGGS